MTERMDFESGQSRRLPNLATFVILAGASTLLGLIYPINDDDIYHLQSLWMTSQGYLPYANFQAGHPPGPWIVLAPWAWTWSNFASSTIVIQARLLVAIGFGFAGTLAASLVMARGLRLALITVLLLGVLVKCMVFLYRIEYLVAPLLWLHLWLLARMETARRPQIHAFLAAVTIGFAGTMSVRVGILLLIQPLYLLVMLLRYHRPWAKLAFGYWLLGGLLGAAPTLCYLAATNLWSEAWLWCITYPSTHDEIRWHAPTGAIDLLQIAVASGALYLLSRESRLPAAARWALGISFAINFAWFLVNPMRGMDYTNIHIFMAWAAMLAIIPFTLLGKWGFDLARIDSVFTPRRFAVAMSIGVAISLLIAWQIDRTGRWSSHRVRLSLRTRHMQNQLLDWLQQVGEGESVFLIDPHHPITSTNATFLRSRWPYRAYLKNSIVAPRVADVAQRILASRPAVISTMPHPDSTVSDVFGYLERRAVISTAEAEDLRAMIASDYFEVEFPMLAESESMLDFGNVFWVRKDRFEANLPPDPHVVRPPIVNRAVLKQTLISR